MSTVLVTGGTGQLGVFLLPRLLQAGFRVVALSRKIEPGASFQPDKGKGRLCWLHPSAMEPEATKQAEMVRTEALISAGPIGVLPDIVSRAPDLRRVVCFSSSSVFVKADSPDRAERVRMQAIRTAEDTVRRMCADRSAALWLLRPTLIYGCGRDRNLSRVAAWIQRFVVLPVAGPAAGMRQPVHADDLAGLAVRALQTGPAESFESVVPGPETLSYRSMMTRVYDALDRKPRLVSVPPALLAGTVRMVGQVPGIDVPSAEMIVRQNRDLVFDDDGIWSRLGVQPRGFRPQAADFAVPPAAAALQPG